ncbi:MAG: cell wall hydrolase, partial [Oscillospiraceae bacterium]|nr:cell wall hydrolase [Oscillospiraceae bacterium]
MPVKFKSELGVTCIVILLCVLLLGLGWLMGGNRVLALGNDLIGAEQPETTDTAPADPEPTPADAALAITEADELQATRAAAKSVAPVTRTVAVGLNDEADTTAAYTLAPILMNGEYVASALAQNGQVFLSIPDVCAMLGFSCTAERADQTVTYTVEGVQMQFTCGEQLYLANGRTLYEANGVQALDGDIVLPPEAMTKLFGAAIAYDPDAETVTIDPANKALLQDGESFYAQYDLYWLSHIVYAESNGQPLEGMIGVGNVVLNRVESERFPNSVQDVVFQPGQFNPVDMGTIYLEPSEQAVLAAKLAIEGVDIVGGSLYFVNPVVGDSSWFNRSLTCVIVIADHAF